MTLTKVPVYVEFWESIQSHWGKMAEFRLDQCLLTASLLSLSTPSLVNAQATFPRVNAQMRVEQPSLLRLSPLAQQPAGLPNPIPPAVPPQPTPDTLPPPEQLFQLPTPDRPAAPTLPDTSGTVTVSAFKIVGSTIFSPEDLNKATADYLNKPLTFTELFQAATAITKLYTDRGYITSGAFIPANQTFSAENGIVTIQVLEGGLEDIQVSGTRRLNPGYVSSRLAIATMAPLNVERLLQALQLLQLDPLLQNVSAELSAGSTAGQSILSVTVIEADSFRGEIKLDNNRSPSVGDFRRQAQLTEANLLGLGDTLNLAYANTEGSNTIDASYTLPVSPYNTTLRFAYSTTASNVVENPFNVLDITASSRSYELTLRQPVIQTPSQELALGISFNHRQSETTLLGIPFPLSVNNGADAFGRTRISALRFFQDFTQRSSQDVIALRSQFSLGLNAFGATINTQAPDSNFFAWRGQGQYVRLLAPDTLMLVRTDIQLADRALVPLEQFGLGGQETIRGYRQDLLLSDNGILLSGEVRLPVLRVPEVGGILQVVPFLDLGSVWNAAGRDAPNPSTLVSGGLGLLWRQGNYLTIRLDYGIPFVSVSGNKNTWQENGFYFSVVYTPF